MSRLEELIRELCPDGVNYLPFFSVAEYIRGVSYSKGKEINDGRDGYKLLRANNINLASNTLNFDDVKIIDYSVKVKESQFLHENDILICAGSGSKEHIGKVAFIFEKLDYTFGGFMGVIRSNDEVVNSRYLFHILTGSIFKDHLAKVSNSSTINNINNDTWKNFVLPVPPMEVQREIVRILDSFTLLTALLTAELTARKKQYEYYRENLLLQADEYPIKSLGNTCRMKSGKAIKAIMLSDRKDDEHEYPCFGGNGIRGYIRTNSHSGEFPIIGRQGALCGNVNYATGDFYATEHAVVVESLGDYEQRYLFYLLTSMNLNQYKSKGAQPGLAVGNIENLMAPVPPLEIQRKVVAILDRFDSLCNNLSAGLPAEIEARRKQYEYYRDKLLTFPKAE